MQLILSRLGLDGRQLQDLVAERARIMPIEGVATTAALLWQKGNGVIGRQQGPLLACMSRLTAALATGRRAWGPAFGGGRIA